jgi:hypothetical protein
MNEFYKYTTIQIIKSVINSITDAVNTKIKKYLKDYYKLENIDEDDIYINLVLAKIIEIIIQENYKRIINKVINNYNKAEGNYIQYGSGKNTTMSTIDIVIFDLTRKDINISLDLNDVVPISLHKTNEYRDFYKLINTSTYDECNPTEKCTFILYPNDLTNIHKFKMKYCILINSDIIEKLLDNGGSPYHTDNDNLTSLFYLLKNYNYEPIEKIKATYKNFSFYTEQYKQYIIEELTNIINKIIPSTPTASGKYQLNCILNNFNEYLYNDIHQLIVTNNRYGSNEFVYLKLSFNISTYLVLHYLTHIISPNMVNYLCTNIKDMNIHNDLNTLIVSELLETRNKLLIHYNTLKEASFGDYKIEIEKEIEIINGQITILEQFVLRPKYYNNISCVSNNNILTDYDSIADTLKDELYGHIKLLKVWKTLFDKTDFINNNNINLIKILLDQQGNITDYEKLKEISDKLPNILYVCENYFTTLKYTEINKTAKFIKDMLNHVAKIVFGTSIILLVRRILFTFFSKMESHEIVDIQNKIETILTDTNFITILEDETLPELVTLASNIYINKTDEMNIDNKSSKQILQKLFGLLKNSSITLPDEILNKFDKHVVEYLDSFIIKTIDMWHVNAENIFKYFINNYRCLKTLLCVMKS